jgi:hypothetical protein
MAYPQSLGLLGGSLFSLSNTPDLYGSLGRAQAAQAQMYSGGGMCGGVILGEDGRNLFKKRELTIREELQMEIDEWLE